MRFRQPALYGVPQIKSFPYLKREAEPSSKTSVFIKESDDSRSPEKKIKSVVKFHCVKALHKSLFLYENKF